MAIEKHLEGKPLLDIVKLQDIEFKYKKKINLAIRLKYLVGSRVSSLSRLSLANLHVSDTGNQATTLRNCHKNYQLLSGLKDQVLSIQYRQTLRMLEK